MKAQKKRGALLTAFLAAAVFFAAAAGFFYLDGRPELLVIENTKTGERIFSYTCRDGLSFSISFLHSVNRSDVEEIFTVKDSKIYLSGCRYRSFGAGVATEIEPGQTLSFEEDGAMLISGIDKEMPRLYYFFSTVYDHYLSIGGEKINISSIGGKGISARIYITRRKA